MHCLEENEPPLDPFNKVISNSCVVIVQLVSKLGLLVAVQLAVKLLLVPDVPPVLGHQRSVAQKEVRVDEVHG